MRSKTKRFAGIHFQAEAIRRACDVFISHLQEGKKSLIAQTFKASREDESWEYESLDEALSEYRKRDTRLDIAYNCLIGAQINVCASDIGSTITVALPESTKIENIFEIFEEAVTTAKPLEPPRPPKDPLKIFIGHGRSNEWKDLMMHLQGKHGYNIEAYETGSRAGHAIRDILGAMVASSSLAILVMTAEDPMEDGSMRARQNVIHEVGLFQGSLGFHRVFVMMEDGCEKFSNFDGIQWIPFAKGNIREGFGDVLAAIKRESC